MNPAVPRPASPRHAAPRHAMPSSLQPDPALQRVRPMWQSGPVRPPRPAAPRRASGAGRGVGPGVEA